MEQSLVNKIKHWIDYLQLMVPVAKEYDENPVENSHKIKLELKHLIKKIVTAKQRI